MSQVRRAKGYVSILELAKDIARHGRLHSLNVRPAVDAHGVNTGLFENPAWPRIHARSLLMTQKRLTSSLRR
ncbi:hypothetical protein [Pseudotabrizicola sp. 4114]|uniref:hypothetical protein n=1 Tax=Pseudotabrizicola sp. 4114 TaxID=2817731 RepID=UPI0032B81326